MDELEFLQSLSEAELTELVLIPLLVAMQYQDVRYTHGTQEYGKDIVCSKRDSIDGRKYLGFTVKSARLDGSVSSSRSIREVFYQLRQALTTPFINPFDGNEVQLAHVYLLTPFSISQNCIRSLKDDLRDLATGVGFIDGPKLRDLVREHVPELLNSISTPNARYLHLLQQRLLRLRTIPAIGTFREHTLPEVYTGGTLSKTTPEEAQYLSFIDAPAVSGRHLASIVTGASHLVVIADVGAGKTTLLEKFSLDIIAEMEKKQGSGKAMVPFIVRLSSLPPQRVKTVELFYEWLEQELSDALGEELGEIRDQAVVLLDGFDEIPTGHSEIQSYLQHIPVRYSNGLIITSRPSRVPLLGPPFEFYRLDPFGESEIFQFLTKWLPGEPERVRILHKKIVDDANLKRFCRTPLLLTMYTALATTTRIDALPTRRTDIYSAISDLLLGEWDLARNVTNEFSSGLKMYYLERLAYQAHKQGLRDISLDAAIREAQNILESHPQTRGVSPHSLLDEIVYRSSLLRPAESKSFEFVHLSFQEFFCAKHLVRRASAKDVQTYLFVDWWKNTLAFYFGLCRSMDHVRLIEKKAIGAGHVLMEYLVEADLTSHATKETVLMVVARQIVSEPDLPESILDVYRRYAADLIPALREVVARSASGFARGEYYSNYFRFLLSLRPHGASDLVHDARFASALRVAQLTQLVLDFPWVFADPAYVPFVYEILQAIHKNLESELRTLNDFNGRALVASLTSEIKDIRTRLHLSTVHEFKDRRQWDLILAGIADELAWHRTVD